MKFSDIIFNAVGILGIISVLIAYQCKKHRNVMIFRTANEMLFAVQYFMLGAYTGMAMNLIGSTRNMTFAYLVERKKSTMLWRYIFSAVVVVFLIFTWDGAKSLLSGIAKISTTFAYGSKRVALVRTVSLLSTTAWLIYNLLVVAYAGAVSEMLTFISIVIGIVRIDLKNRTKTEVE